MQTDTLPQEAQPLPEHAANPDQAALADMLTDAPYPEIQAEALTPVEVLAGVNAINSGLNHTWGTISNKILYRAEVGGETALREQDRELFDHGKDGTLDQVGIDLSHADLPTLLDAIAKGKPPVEIDAVRVDVGPHTPAEVDELPPDERVGLYLGAVFRGITAEAPQARIVATLENDQQNQTTLEADDHHVIETAEMLGRHGALEAGDDAGEDFIIVGQEEQLKQLEGLADQLSASQKGQMSQSADGSIVFRPDQTVLAAAGLAGTAIEQEGITLSQNGAVDPSAMRACSLLASGRQDAVHLSIVSAKEAGEHQQAMALLAALGKDMSKYQSIVIDTTKLDPLLASLAVNRELLSAVNQVREEAIFTIVVEEGVTSEHAPSPGYAAKAIVDRFDRVSDERVKQLVPAMVEAVYYHSESMFEGFAEKLIDRLGEELVDSPDFQHLWENPRFLRIVGLAHTDYIGGILEKEKETGVLERPSELRQKVWGKFFDALGMDEKQRTETRAAWGSRQKTEVVESAKQQIREVTTLFADRPDSPRLLYERFGIRNFGRYGAGALLRQLEAEEAGKLADYLTLVVSARDDWNGGLGSVDRIIRNEAQTTHPGASEQMVVVEAASSVELLRRLVSVARRFKAIDRLLVAAHGSQSSIDFGDDKLTIDSVQSSIAATRLTDRRILAEDGEIILKSCSTGKEGGIAQTIARQVGLQVTASAVDSAVGSSVKRSLRDRVFRRQDRGKHYLQWSSDGKAARANIYNNQGRKIGSTRRVEF